MYLIIMGTKMTLDKCQYNHTYKVVAINLNNAAIKDRFTSLGIIVGADLTLLYASPNKATLSIQVGQALIALRLEEAKHIKVEAHKV